MEHKILNVENLVLVIPGVVNANGQERFKAWFSPHPVRSHRKSLVVQCRKWYD